MSIAQLPKVSNYIVGIAYDERMLLHKLHNRVHVEKPERLTMIYSHLISSGLMGKCKRLPTREATDSDVNLAHSQNHIEKIKSTAIDYADFSNPKPLKEGINTKKFSNDTYENVYTCKAAYVSAGCTLSATEAVAKGQLNSCFSLVRPAGHHAGVDSFSGFCYLNNVAISALYSIAKLGVKKVAIVDWDIHHGNGTQEILYSRKDILKISLHRYDKKAFFPRSGAIEEIGSGDGTGFNVNIPWDSGKDIKEVASITDRDYVYAFKTIVLPILSQYKPDIILVACGFDSANGDPLGKIMLTPASYYWMTKKLMEVCPKMVISLEGGYNLKVIPTCTEQCIKGLLGEAVSIDKDYENTLPSEGCADTVHKVKATLGKYWSL